MKNIKVRIDKEALPESEALKGKNFDAVLSKASKTNQSLLKGKAWYIGIGLSAIIVLLSLYFFADNKETHNNKEQASTSASIRPFPNIQLEYERFEINPTIQNVITTKNGSEIVIPANSIVDKKGNLMKEPLTIKYKEYRDMVDVFLSGITMQYDSGGATYHFESAGMFEIAAFKGDEELFLNQDSSIVVNYSSEHLGDKYNIYQFNKADNKWNYMYKDTSALALKPDLETELETVESEIKTIEASIPPAPVMETPKSISIKLDVLESEFPEIAIYDNIKFQITDSKDFNVSESEMEWDVVQVKKSATGDYVLHFESGKTIKEYNCIPVFEKKDYGSAMKMFEEKYKKSLALLEEKKAAREEMFKKLNAEKDAQAASLRAYNLKQMNISEAMATNEKIMRTFSIESFGIYNSDYPQDLPQGATILAQLKDKKETKPDTFLIFKKLHLVEKEKNALYTYYSPKNFSFNPKEENMIWTVTDDNKLAFISYENFKKMDIIGKGESFTLEMTVIKEEIKTEAQIRKYLEI